jgi:predicted GTPase
VGEERTIVCDMSGTTRDAVDTPVTLPTGERLTLIDTAGIRKRARVADSKDGAESISVDRAMRAMGRAEVVVMVVDAEEGVTQQVIAGTCCGCVWLFVVLSGPKDILLVASSSLLSSLLTNLSFLLLTLIPVTLTQDFRLSELIAREGRAAVIVLNKWDKVDAEKMPMVGTSRARSG